MAYLGLLAALLILLHPTGALLRISTASPQITFAGSDVLLHCTFSIDGSPPDPHFLTIMWYYQGKEIAKYQSKVETFHPRVSIDAQAAKSGTASLSLANAEIEDEGIYMCSVTYSSKREEEEIILSVLVLPKIQIIQIPSKAVSEKKEKKLACSARDFYPVDIAVTWYRNGEVLRNSSLGKIQKNKNGTYNVDNTVTITADHLKSQTFSCRVRHESLAGPLQVDFQDIYGDQTEETSAVTVIVCVCGAVVLVVLSVIGLLMWRLKPWRKVELSEIVGPDKLIDGEVVTLCCTGNLCTKKTRVIWLEEKEGREAETIPNRGGDLEEAERLLNTSYVIDTKDEGSERYSSNLRFTFHVANHKGVTFICRFISGKKTLEKRFHCTNIYAKPKLVNPVKPSLCVSGEILYSLRLNDFYPRDIQIRWSRVTRESQEIISSEEQYEENPDLTFSVCSEARISEKFFKDRECKVCVTWEHGSMDRSETREMSMLDPDFPWRPVMEEITVPKLEAAKPVTLSCKISGYFPDSLSVEWIKMEKGNKSETKLPTTDYKVQDTTAHKAKDKTFSRVTRLTFTPHLERDQGAEFICRVRHPTLEEPTEKRTGPLLIVFTGKPEVSDIKESRRSGSYYLEVDKFYPRDLQITWRLDEAFGESQCQSLSSSIGDFTVNANGTYKVTSTCEPLGDKADKSKTYYLKAFVNHVSLKTEVQKRKVLLKQKTEKSTHKYSSPEKNVRDVTSPGNIFTRNTRHSQKQPEEPQSHYTT